MARSELTTRLACGAVMALAAASPGWFLWKHYLPLAAVFLACGFGFGAWLVGGAVARRRSIVRIAFNGAAAAALSFPIIGFFVGLGKPCLDAGLAVGPSCASLDSGIARAATLLIEEAAKSMIPVMLLGGIAGMAAARLARWT